MHNGWNRWQFSRHAAGVWLLFIVGSGGLVWLTSSVTQGLRSERDFDLHRRWVVSQFVRRDINPYPLALTILQRKYGTLGDGRDKPRVYDIPRLSAEDPAAIEPARPLLAAYGTPEAVYPPSADLLLSLAIGWLPEERVHLAGIVGNLVLLVVGTMVICRLLVDSSLSAAALTVTAAVMLCWAPILSTISTGQFSLFVLVCLLLTFACSRNQEYLAGICFGLALIKPSVTLPFLIYPLIHGQWRALLTAGVLHLAGTGVQAMRFGVAPWELLHQWTGVAAYFTQGQFTLQEVLSAAHLADTPAGLAVIGAFVIFALGWCLVHRASPDAALVDFLCFVSILWTYHGPYDFVILLIPLTRQLLTSKSRGLVAWMPLVGFACVSAATSPLVYGDEVHIAARLIRHAARLFLLLGFAASAVAVWRSARAAKSVPQRQSHIEVVREQEELVELSA
jgi:hypothetical protein